MKWLKSRDLFSLSRALCFHLTISDNSINAIFLIADEGFLYRTM